MNNLKLTAQESKDQGFVFDGIGKITSYIGDERNIIIPSMIDEVEVTKIGKKAFKGKDLTSVIIPESVTTIESYAFKNCKMINLVIPKSVTKIGIGAFNNNNLPNNQAFIYERNNDGSENKTTIVSYGGSNRYIVTIPEGVARIGHSAFEDNKIEFIVFPESLTKIYSNAFKNNKLTLIVIPDSVIEIGLDAFSYNYLREVEIPESVITVEYRAFNNNSLPDNQAFIYARNNDGSEDKTTIVSYGGMSRENIIIPKGVTVIGDGAFYDHKIKSITIPDSVTTIKNIAFLGNSLKSITIPNSVRSIGDYAFSSNQLTEVEIPESVRSIGEGAFANNESSAFKESNCITDIQANGPWTGTWKLIKPSKEWTKQ